MTDNQDLVQDMAQARRYQREDGQELTNKQRVVLRLIARRYAQGLYTGAAEVAKEFSWASVNTAYCYFDALRSAGYLDGVRLVGCRWNIEFEAGERGEKLKSALEPGHATDQGESVPGEVTGAAQAEAEAEPPRPGEGGPEGLPAPVAGQRDFPL